MIAGLPDRLAAPAKPAGSGMERIALRVRSISAHAAANGPRKEM
jgi:hypothetical protein